MSRKIAKSYWTALQFSVLFFENLVVSTIGLIYAVKKQRNIYIWVIRDQETEYWVDQRNT